MILQSKAEGAGDIPEDILGALDQALQLDFYSKTCLIYLVADAPCHGTQYHDCGRWNDDHPDQHDPQLLEIISHVLLALLNTNVLS